LKEKLANLGSKESELLKLLIEATRKRAVIWSDSGGDYYCTDNDEFGLSWLSWFNSEGISIGRQGMVLNSRIHRQCCLWGTNSIQQIASLLSEIDVGWKEYFDVVFSECDKHMNGVKDSTNDWQDACMALLNRLNAATKDGSTVWKAEGAKTYVTEIDRTKYSITYLQPVDYNDIALTDMVVQLSFPRVTVEFVCGTDGYFAIEEMLAFCIPELRNRLIEKLAALESALRQVQAITGH
jgi:hypothetical protein